MPDKGVFIKNDEYDGVVLVDPTTGLPYSAAPTSGATVTANQGTAGSSPWPTTDSNASQTITPAGTAPAKVQGVQSDGGKTLALDASLQTINGTLNKPFQVGGSIGNTAFGISGQLPAFAATPTVNLGTLNGAALDTSVQAVKAALGSPFQAGGSIANTGFNVLQGGAANTSSNPLYEQTVGPSMQAPGTAPTIVRGIQGAAAGIPVNTNAQQLAGTALGAPTAYGTAPTGNVQGVNASVTASVLPTGAATAANQNVTAPGTTATAAQAVQGVTNGVPMPTVSAGGTIAATQSGNWASQSQYSGILVTLNSGNFTYPQIDKAGQYKTSETGSSDPLVGISPATSAPGGATSLVAKASPGNLYSVSALNLSTTAAYLVVINSTTVPASGATIFPQDAAYIGGSVGSSASINFAAGPPSVYSSGITVLITTSLTSYTPGGSGFINARVR